MPKWITETLLLAALPVVASVVAYEYSAGYFDYFALPLDLIQIDTTTVLRCLVATALVSGLGLYLGHSAILLQPKHPIGKALAETFEVCALLGILCLLAGKLLPLPLGLAAGAIANAWWPTRIFWIHGREKTYPEKLQQAKAQDIVDSIQATGRHFVFGRWHYPPAALALLFLWLFNVAYWYGWREASSKQQFMIAQSPETVAIVRFQGGFALGVAYDEKSHVMSGGVVILPLSETRKFTGVKVGKLLQSNEKAAGSEPVPAAPVTKDARVACSPDCGLTVMTGANESHEEADLMCSIPEGSR